MSRAYYWLCLLGSIVFEVSGTSIMKLSQETWPVLGMGLMYGLLGISYFLLAQAVLRLPIGVSYAFWEGVGLVLVTLMSVLILGENLGLLHFAGLGLVLLGVLFVHHGTDDARAVEEDAQPGGV